MTNRYAGTCHDCGRAIAACEGELEYIGHSRRGRGSRYQLWCMGCYDKSDNSGYEDRCCGDRAYEDQCAAACGM